MLIYFHIPKTAGTSFRFWARSAFKKDDVYWHGLQESGLIEDSNIETLSKAKLIGGHFAASNRVISSVEKTFGAGNIWYLAVLRDPIERIASHFNYVSERPNHPQYTELSLDEALKKGKTRFYDSQKNLQCSYFSKTRTYEDALLWIKQRNCIVGDFKNMSLFYKEIEKIYDLTHVDLMHRNKSPKNYSHIKKSKILEAYVESFCAGDSKLYDLVNHSGVFINRIGN